MLWLLSILIPFAIILPDVMLTAWTRFQAPTPVDIAREQQHLRISQWKTERSKAIAAGLSPLTPADAVPRLDFHTQKETVFKPRSERQRESKS